MNDQVERELDGITSVAAWKSSDVVIRRHFDRGITPFMTHELFCAAYTRHMAQMECPEFWAKPDKERDAIHGYFCRVYVMLNSPDEEYEVAAARMFQRVREIFVHRSLKKLREDFEIKLKDDGWERGDIVDGIQHYHCKDGRAFQLRESPKPGPVNKRRKKS